MNIPLIKVDENGYEIDVITFHTVDKNGNEVEIPQNYIHPYDNGFFTPRWDFNKNIWVEGLSEIELLDRNAELETQQSHPFSTNESVNALKVENEMNALSILELSNLLLGGMGGE